MRRSDCVWEDTRQYKEIMTAAYKYEKSGQLVHINAIFVRSNGETQEKDLRIKYPVWWLTDVLDVYWASDEAEIKVTIGNETIYWKHPTLTAPVTIKDIEKENKRWLEEFKKSVIRVDEHTITFGGQHG